MQSAAESLDAQPRAPGAKERSLHIEIEAPQVKTETTELRGARAIRAICAMDAANIEKLNAGEGYYGVKHLDRAILVEPINGNPFVMIDTTADPRPGTVSLPIVQRVEWVPKEGSGTDKLRARIEANLFFDNLPGRTFPPIGELIVQPLLSAKKSLGPCQGHDQASQEALEQDAQNASPSP